MKKEKPVEKKGLKEFSNFYFINRKVKIVC